MRLSRTFLLLLGLGLFQPAYATTDCEEGELSFDFRDIKITKAFAILADFAKLEPRIDQSIPDVGSISFKCLHWETAAEELADRYSLKLVIEDGVMNVSQY